MSSTQLQQSDSGISLSETSRGLCDRVLSPSFPVKIKNEYVEADDSSCEALDLSLKSTHNSTVGKPGDDVEESTVDISLRHQDESTQHLPPQLHFSSFQASGPPCFPSTCLSSNPEFFLSKPTGPSILPSDTKSISQDQLRTILNEQPNYQILQQALLSINPSVIPSFKTSRPTSPTSQPHDTSAARSPISEHSGTSVLQQSENTPSVHPSNSHQSNLDKKVAMAIKQVLGTDGASKSTDVGFSVHQSSISSGLSKRSELAHRCLACGKAFERKFSLKRHLLTHTREKPYSCTLCSKSFTQSFYLTTHMKSHTGDLPFRCKWCEKAFVRKQHLDDHERIHTGDRPFSCSVCGKSFGRHHHLVNHLGTHSAYKPLSCALCGKAFTRRDNLDTHIKNHTRPKEHDCNVCGKAYHRKRDLLRHIERHTKDKPYKCNICAKTFSQAANLSAHLISHSEKKVFCCSICDRSFTREIDFQRHSASHKVQSSDPKPSKDVTYSANQATVK